MGKHMDWKIVRKEIFVKKIPGIHKEKGDTNMLFLEYPQCSTCKNAKKWLDEHQVA